MAFSDFFANFSRLAAIKAQMDQQKLAERQAGAQMMNTFGNIVGQLAPEARDSFTQAFAQNTGLDPALLQQTARALPQSVQTTTAKKVAAGANAVPDSAVAASQLTGQGEGQVAAGHVLAGAVNDAKLTPDFLAQIVSMATTGQGVGRNALDMAQANLPPDQLTQAAQIGTGLAPSVPQSIGFGLEKRGQDLSAGTARRGQDLSAAVQREGYMYQNQWHASDDALQNLAIAVQSGKNGGKGANGEAVGMTPDQSIQLMNSMRQAMDMLSKTEMTRASQIQYATLLYQGYKMQGAPEETAKQLSGLNIIEQGGNITPNTFQRVTGFGLHQGVK